MKFYQDPKFWTAVVDTVVSLALYFVGKYGPAGLLDDMKFAIVALQPIFALVIAGVFQSQQASIARGVLPKFMK